MGVDQIATSIPGLDPDGFGRWIAALELGARPPLRFERIGNGFSNLTYLVGDAAGARWVLRRPPLGEVLASAHDVTREYRVMRALEPTAVRSPRTFGLCTDAAVSQVPLALLEYVDGLVVETPAIATGLTPALRREIGRNLPRALAEVHAVDLGSTGLGELSRSRTPYAERQLRRWLGQWEQSRTRDLPAVEELAERFRRALPAQPETTLLHGDFHLLNVIVSPRDGAVLAVLDWELCTLGDPIADLGGFLAYWPEADEPAGPLGAFGAVPDFPSKAELAAGYEAASGRSLESLGFWHALGVWKIAVIVEGVLSRFSGDPRNATRVTIPSHAQIDELLSRASAIAETAGI